MKIKFNKKLYILFLLLIICNLFFPLFSYADESQPETYCPSALLMDYNTGKILYEKNIDDVIDLMESRKGVVPTC